MSAVAPPQPAASTPLTLPPHPQSMQFKPTFLALNRRIRLSHTENINKSSQRLVVITLSHHYHRSQSNGLLQYEYSLYTRGHGAQQKYSFKSCCRLIFSNIHVKMFSFFKFSHGYLFLFIHLFAALKMKIF